MSQTMSNIRRNSGSLNEQLNAIPFPTLLEQSREAVMNALPKHMSVDRIMRIALTAFRRNDALQKCNPVSVLSAVVQASQLGLEIGQNGEAFLVPFKAECQLVPGYKGLMKLVLQTGHVVEIYAQEVRENDLFKQIYGLNRSFVHEPLCHRGFLASDAERGLVTGFYAVAVLQGGERTYVTMSEGQVNKIRDESSGYRYALNNNKPTPWIDDYVAMGMKTALRALCNKLPMSTELRTALALDTAANLGVSQSLSLRQAADGSYEAPNFDDAYQQQQQAARDTANPQQSPRQATPRPSAAPRSAPRATSAPQDAPQAPVQSAPRAATPGANAAPASKSPQVPPEGAAKPAAARVSSDSQSPAEVPVKDLITQMRTASSEKEINALYVQAQPLCFGRDLDQLNYEFDTALQRLEVNTKDMFPA